MQEAKGMLPGQAAEEMAHTDSDRIWPGAQWEPAWAVSGGTRRWGFQGRLKLHNGLVSHTVKDEAGSE